MKKELELLKIGTASKSFGAAAGLVMVKDGIASTYDGTTRVQVPLDMADCQFQLTPAASALQVMSEPTVTVDKSALVISEGKMRVRVPLVVVDAFTPPSSHGELQDAPVSILEAMAHVASFCGAGGARPFTSCVRVVGGFAYATDSYSGGRYPVEDKDLTITLEVKQLAPLLKLKIERLRHDGCNLILDLDGGATVTTKLSVANYPDVAVLFRAIDKSNFVTITDETRQAVRTAGALFLEDSVGSIHFKGGKLSTLKDQEVSQYCVDVQGDLGDGSFTFSRINKVIAKAERGIIKAGEACFFSQGSLDMTAVGLRE